MPSRGCTTVFEPSPDYRTWSAVVPHRPVAIYGFIPFSRQLLYYILHARKLQPLCAIFFALFSNFFPFRLLILFPKPLEKQGVPVRFLSFVLLKRIATLPGVSFFEIYAHSSGRVPLFPRAFYLPFPVLFTIFSPYCTWPLFCFKASLCETSISPFWYTCIPVSGSYRKKRRIFAPLRAF